MRLVPRFVLTSLIAIAIAWLTPNVATAAPKFHLLYSFCPGGFTTGCLDGSGPRGALLRDSSGNFFGTTFGGGRGGNGTAFVLTPSGHRYRVFTMKSFCKPGGSSCTDGDSPTANFILDTNGNLYTTTLLGGSGSVPADAGTVLEFTPGADLKHWSVGKPHDFCKISGCPDGGGPRGGLAYAGMASGALYDGTSPLFGTTQSGGNSANGVVFELRPPHGQHTKWVYKVIYAFCASQPCVDGSDSQAGLIADASGNLYGVTSFGGAENDGTVFELSPSGSAFTETVLYSFCTQLSCSDGSQPHGSLAFDAQGNLIGTTSTGGAFNKGTVFKVVPNGASSTESVLYSFCPDQSTCVDGSGPQASMLIAANGTMYGTTQSGGGAGDGVAFQLKGANETVLCSFCQLASCADGAAPVAGLIADDNGVLYGTTLGGGAGGQGTVFSLNP